MNFYNTANNNNTNYNFPTNQDICFKEIDPYETPETTFPNIINLNDQNYHNFFNFPNSNENEMINDSLFDNYSKEEIKFQGNNNNEIISPYNENFYAVDKQKSEFLGKKHKINNDEKNTFKKNRNNLNNYLFKITIDKIDKNNNNINISSETSSNSHIKKIKSFNKRNDSFLIKFKSFLGKSFIAHIKKKLKILKKKTIKFYAFNYSKFTLIATYNKNKEWLNEKMKDLLILGGEKNQQNNEKALKLLYRRKEPDFNEIKNLLEMSYREIIERFYSTEYFDDFKKDEENIKADEEFVKVMKVSLLEKNGFITFLLTRKGNKEKSY